MMAKGSVYPIDKIISGGQTGVDRAALDVAIVLNVPCSGWCPKGRKSEDGPIPFRYPLRETPTSNYEQRTEWNVRDSDGTLLLYRGVFNGGTALTEQVAVRMKKPHLRIDLADNPDPMVICDWINKYHIKVLNIAGPRESKEPGVRDEAALFLVKFLITSPVD